MKYYWDELDELIVKVEIVGEGTVDNESLIPIRFGPITIWVRPEEIFDSEDAEYLQMRKRMAKEFHDSNQEGLKKSAKLKTEASYLSRPSMLKCPHCPSMLTDVFKDRKKGRRNLFVDSVCHECGYSVRGVEVPDGPLIERLTD